MQFSDTATPDSVADEWYWSFGDGGAGTAQHPTYTYTQPGPYSVTQRITDTQTGEWDVLTHTHYVSVASPLVTRIITYTYDGLYRLVEADYRSTGLTAGSSGEQFAYRYDAVGNRTAYTATITQTTVTTYTYDAANRLVNAGGVDYTWDNRGNLLDDGTYQYTWNTAGRLITVTDGITTLGFLYDGDGNRLARSVNGTLTTHTLDLGLGLPEVLVEHDGDDVTRYLHLPHSIATDDGAAWSYSAADGLGSVRQELDASGQVVSAQGYRPFGSPLAGGGGSPYGFTGEWWEGDAGLLFLRARYYAPSQGRFLSEDTVPGYAKRPLTQHLWLYALANPVRYIDPSGHQVAPPQDCEPGEICFTGTTGPYNPGFPAYLTPEIAEPELVYDIDWTVDWMLGQYRYLRTESYGWFDMGHASPKNRLFRDVRAAAKTGGEVVVGGRVRDPFKFYAYYWAEKLDDNQVEGVALGIFMDHSYRVEKWQGEFPLGLGSGTSFAIEDYPSNYIGFLAAFRNRGQATKVDSAQLIIDYLGPVEWTNVSPPHSDSVHVDCRGMSAQDCWATRAMYRMNVKNYEFTPRIEIAPGNYANIAWPCDDLVIQPVPSGPDTWHFLREEHNRGFKTYVKAIWDRITPW